MKAYYELVKAPENHPRHKHGTMPKHLAIAEAAVGRWLPSTVKVHHVDGDSRNNANSNLVVCEDQAYHILLHIRTRALRACGNPNFRKCTFCKKWDDPCRMKIQPPNPKGRTAHHVACANDYKNAHRKR